MFSKEESKRLREEFWTAFGKSFPRKWILYQTTVKDLNFKFHFDTKKAAVSIDFEQANSKTRQQYFEKFIAFKGILEAFIPDLVFEELHFLNNGKAISSIYKELHHVSIHNKNTWQETMIFLKENMDAIEQFWIEYQDVIKA